MRKKIYGWHRRCSMIIALPVVLWALSGFMHPVMTNIRPRVATQLYEPSPIDPSQLIVPLSRALQGNGIATFANVHIIRMGGQQFYQVLVDPAHNDIRYISSVSGRHLTNGDQLYAQFLARKFLTGSGNTATPGAQALSDHDCCMSAALNILNSKGAAIQGVEKVNDFKGEYSYINRLLPVYKVRFNRPDGIRIYVETASGSYAYAVDNKRAVFDKIFGLLHTWNWMNAMGKMKYFIMVVVTVLALLTTLMGLYIFFIIKPKKAGSPVSKTRRNHRYTSLVASLFTLMFCFSGGFHALKAF
ncbi:MAG: PepSY domain-containing protein [Niabella sp.]|nr:PepSY domain-containing protein [Niabella sp.]